jgi:hypothetical protein
VNLVLGGVPPNEENPLPETPVGINAEEPLAQRDKAHNVQDRVWCQLMQLNTVHKQEPTKEFVGRERNATIYKGEE